VRWTGVVRDDAERRLTHGAWLVLASSWSERRSLYLVFVVDEIVDERNEKGDVEPARVYIPVRRTPVQKDPSVKRGGSAKRANVVTGWVRAQGNHTAQHPILNLCAK
jgi:hypothetical protein